MTSRDIHKEPAAAEVDAAEVDVEHMGSLQEHSEALVAEGLAYTAAVVRPAYTAVVSKLEHQVLDRRAGQGLHKRVDRVQGRDVGEILGKRLALVGPGWWGIRWEGHRNREGTLYQVESA